MPEARQVPNEADFEAKKPDIDQLRRYPIPAQKLTGSFTKSPKVYDQPNGKVIHWTLEQGKTANPTLVRIPQGTFNVTPDHMEGLTILEGGRDCLSISTNKSKGADAIVLSQGEAISLVAEEEYQLTASRPVLYFCQYKPIQEMGQAWIIVAPEGTHTQPSAPQEILKRIGEDIYSRSGTYSANFLFTADSDDNQIEDQLHNLKPDSPAMILIIEDEQLIRKAQGLCQFAGTTYNATNIILH